MSIKRVSDLSSILFSKKNTTGSTTQYINLDISAGISRDVVLNNQVNTETSQLKEAMFEVSWPKSNSLPTGVNGGYTNFESRSMTYETLSAYITHNILFETYTFVGDKTFDDNVRVRKNLSVLTNTVLGNSQTNSNVTINANCLSAKVNEAVLSAFDDIVNTASNYYINAKNNINISSINDLTIKSKNISMETSGSTAGTFSVKGYNTDISAADNIILKTGKTSTLSNYNFIKLDSNNSENKITLSAKDIEIHYGNTFTIYCGTTPVLTLAKNSSGIPTVAFNQTSAGTNTTNPIYGTIKHALWS